MLEIELLDAATFSPLIYTIHALSYAHGSISFFLGGGDLETRKKDTYFALAKKGSEY